VCDPGGSDSDEQVCEPSGSDSDEPVCEPGGSDSDEPVCEPGGSDSDEPLVVGLSCGVNYIAPACMISSPVAGSIDWLGRREEEEARIPMRAGWVGQGCMHQACDPVCLDSDELNWDGQ
jgi:hypothetical protein